MDAIENCILEQFEFDPYSQYYVKDFEKIILENKNELNNIEVFIRNNILENKITLILDKLSETDYIVKYENDKEETYYSYHPDKLNNNRILELENQIKINNELINELQKKLEELSIKVNKNKRFWFF
jgi:hypothetical protein